MARSGSSPDGDFADRSLARKPAALTSYQCPSRFTPMRTWASRMGRAVAAKSLFTGLILGSSQSNMVSAQTSGRWYSVVTENSADGGVLAKIHAQQATCPSTTTTGFVYSAIWQGVNNNVNHWLETGITQCDAGTTNPRWVYAKNDANGYAEWYVGTASLGTSTEYKIARADENVNARHHVWINGTYRATFYRTWGSSNSADTGLEVNNRGNATSPPATSNNTLRYKPNSGTTLNWNNYDICAVDAPTVSGQMFNSTTWKTAVNNALSGGNSC